MKSDAIPQPDTYDVPERERKWCRGVDWDAATSMPML